LKQAPENNGEAITDEETKSKISAFQSTASSHKVV
jgi:hypothetical protein